MDQITSGSYYSSNNNNNNNNNNYMNAKNNCSEGLDLDEVNDAQPHHNHQFNFVKRGVPLTSSATPGTTKNMMGRHRTSISEPKSFVSNNLNSLDFWDYTIELECLQGPKDLQLAAELGKTLLERNRELENELKQHQSTIDDQAQEIEYLQKSKTALEEVNQARLNFYEKLEDGISKMERDHQQLIIENNNEKKSNKTLKRNVEQLESKIEELHKNLAEAQKNFIAEKRKNERLEKERNSEENCVMKVNFRKMETPINESLHDDIDGYLANQTADSCNFAFQSPRNPKANSTGISFNGLNGTYQETDGEADEEILRVVGDLEKALQSEKERVNELEDQLGEMIVENKTLQGRIAQTSTNEHYKSVHDELSSLDEVRQGQMCSRCLRQVQDQYGYDETLSIAPTEDDDDLVDSASAINASRSEHIAPAPIKADCPICSNATKYLHDMPIHIENILPDVLENFFSNSKTNYNILRWILKMLQWPALVICRMISSFPEYSDNDDFSLIF